MAPFSFDAGLRYEAADLPLFVEGTFHYVGGQNRVAISRGELTTDRYNTVDLITGFTVWKRLSLQLGANNIFDANYTNHLNAKNPFTGMQIAEPGRYFFVDLNIHF